MKTSDKFDKVFPAFARCLSQVVKAKKDSEAAVTASQKRKYADLESVNNAIGPAMEANGLVLTQHVLHEEGQAKDVILLETTIIHVDSCQWISSVMQLPMAKADAPGAGSAITYARRYAKLAIFDLLVSDDDGEKSMKTTNDWLREVKQAETEDDVQAVAKAARRTQDSALFKVVMDDCTTRIAKIRADNAKGFNPSKPVNAEPGKKTVTVEDAPNNEPAPQEVTIDHEAESFNNEGF